jgi:hypothetical protein
MRPLALALFLGAMYLICWGVAAGAQRWGIVFPLGVVALELLVARAIDCRQCGSPQVQGSVRRRL